MQFCPLYPHISQRNSKRSFRDFVFLFLSLLMDGHVQDKVKSIKIASTHRPPQVQSLLLMYRNLYWFSGQFLDVGTMHSFLSYLHFFMSIDIALGVVCPGPVAFWVSEPIPIWITDLRNFFCNQSWQNEKQKKKSERKTQQSALKFSFLMPSI